MTAMHNSQEGRAEANGLRADSTFRERHGFHCLRAYCLVFLLSASRLAAAQSVELTPSKTNTLIQVTSSAGSAQLSNGQGDIYVGRTNQDGQGPATISIRRGLIAFDIADNVPAGATITGVTLTVEEIRGLNGNQFTSLNRMYRDWGQGTSYFNGGQGARPATETQPGITPFTTPPILRPARLGPCPAENRASTIAPQQARWSWTTRATPSKPFHGRARPTP